MPVGSALPAHELLFTAPFKPKAILGLRVRDDYTPLGDD